MDSQDPKSRPAVPKPSPFQFGIGSILIFSVIASVEFSVEHYYPGTAWLVAYGAFWVLGGIIFLLALVSAVWPPVIKIIHKIGPWAGIVWVSFLTVALITVLARRVPLD